MEFLLKVRASDALRQKDIIEDLRDGLHMLVGSGDPFDPYLQKLKEVKIIRYHQPKKLKRSIDDKGETV